jgi:hypothetical protein
MPDDRTPAGEARGGRAGNGLLIGLAVAALLLAGLDFVYERDPYFDMEGWAGFYALCGAGAAVLGIALARALGSIATRPEEDYDR